MVEETHAEPPAQLKPSPCVLKWMMEYFVEREMEVPIQHMLVSFEDLFCPDELAGTPLSSKFIWWALKRQIDDCDLRCESLIYLHHPIVRSLCDESKAAKAEWQYLFIELQRQIVVASLMFESQHHAGKRALETLDEIIAISEQQLEDDPTASVHTPAFAKAQLAMRKDLGNLIRTLTNILPSKVRSTVIAYSNQHRLEPFRERMLAFLDDCKECESWQPCFLLKEASRVLKGGSSVLKRLVEQANERERKKTEAGLTSQREQRGGKTGKGAPEINGGSGANQAFLNTLKLLHYTDKELRLALADPRSDWELIRSGEHHEVAQFLKAREHARAVAGGGRGGRGSGRGGKGGSGAKSDGRGGEGNANGHAQGTTVTKGGRGKRKVRGARIGVDLNGAGGNQGGKVKGKGKGTTCSRPKSKRVRTLRHT